MVVVRDFTGCYAADCVSYTANMPTGDHKLFIHKSLLLTSAWKALHICMCLQYTFKACTSAL